MESVGIEIIQGIKVDELLCGILPIDWQLQQKSKSNTKVPRKGNLKLHFELKSRLPVGVLGHPKI
jgi:hypothetical protein